MVVNVQLISKEMIKPPSPTPHHLRNHNLSWLDQLLPPTHIPIIYFYKFNKLLGHKYNHEQVSQQLKTSLSETLTLFYPFAGKIVDYLYVDCNDDGVEFIEARAHAHLSKVIENPEMEELKQFLPFDPMVITGNKLILAVQVNYLDCGGIAVGVCVSHTVADCTSLVTFVNSWAANCSDASKINRIGKPNFNLALNFPTMETPLDFQVSISPSEGKIVTKRYVFDKNMISSLQEAFSRSEVTDPTRVEAISTFIWMFLQKLTNSKNKKSAVGHAVNLRPRTSSFHLESDVFMGNFFIYSLAIEGGLKECQGKDLIGLLRKSIRDIDDDYVRNLTNGEVYFNLLKNVEEMMSNGEIELRTFSSWCSFPLYEADFGWGRPVWLCTTTSALENEVVLIDTRSGDGIEAWIDLLEDDVALLDKQFVSFFPQ